MNKEIIEGYWKEIKGKLQQQWSDLTEDDIGKMQGTYDELAGLLEQRYGYAKDQIEKEIDFFLKKNNWK